MPQISKQIPIKAYQNIPATYASREYMTYMGRSHVVSLSESLATDTIKKWCFYHATRPYGFSLDAISNAEMIVGLYSSEDSDLPSAITPLVGWLNCTNDWQRTTFDLDFGTVAGTIDPLDYFLWHDLLGGVMLEYGKQQTQLICAPAVYYILYVKNVDAATKQQTIHLKFTDFLGVP